MPRNGNPLEDSNRATGSPWWAPSAVAALLFFLALATGGPDNAAGPLPPRVGTADAASRSAGARPAATLAPAVRAAAAKLDPGEQVAQLFLVATQGATPRRPDWAGVIVGGAPPAELRRLARRARPVPLLIASTALPYQPELGEVPVRKVAAEYRRVGRSLRADGAGLALGLSADVAAAAGPLAEVAFGDHGAQVSPRARAALDGLRAARLLAVVAHFPGQGTASQSPMDGPASVGLNRAELRNRDLAPFRAVIDRADAVMVSSAVYAAYGGATPASLSVDVVRSELRGRLGFSGVAMSDDLAGVTAVTGGSVGEAAVEALRAGIDLLYVGDDRQADAAHRAVLNAVRTGELPATRVREAVERVLELKRRAGLL